jgi:predicted aspartyl protease
MKTPPFVLLAALAMRQRYPCAAIAAALSFSSFATLHGDLLPADVPFDLVAQHLIVAKGSIAGLSGLNLLLDTGTTPSIVDKRVAARLKLKGEPSVLVAFGQRIKSESTTLSGLRLGPFEPGDVPAVVGDLSYVQSKRIDAVVGVEVLAQRNFRIDYAARTLSFGPAERESAEAPLKVIWRFLTVRLSIAGHPMQLLVDTGSGELVLFKARMPVALLPLPWKGERIIQHASGVARMRRYELRQATLGEQHWDTLNGFVLDTSTAEYPEGIDGVLGVRALGVSRVQFDFERGQLGWSR